MASPANVITSAKLRGQPLPADDLSTRLHLLAKLRQIEAPIPHRQRPQTGSGSSNLVNRPFNREWLSTPV
jgi:hypothetical protein